MVRDLMTIGVETCSPETPLADIARGLLEKGIEALVVVEPGDRHALGMVSQDELVKAWASPAHPDVRSLKAADVMRDQIPQIPADIPITAAAQIMIDLRVRTLYVMHQSDGVDYPAGLITFRHILRHLAAHNPEDLRDLGVQAKRKTPVESFIERRDAARQNNQRKK